MSTADYSLHEQQVHAGIYVIEVRRQGIFERRGTGTDRESALARLKLTCRLAVSEGERAKEIFDFLEKRPCELKDFGGEIGK